MANPVQLEKDFIQQILLHGFDYGFISIAEKFIREKLYEEDIPKFLYNVVESYDKDDEIVLVCFHILSHINSNFIGTEGFIKARRALKRDNPEIIEAGIRMLENWGDRIAIILLADLNTGVEWLDEYAQEVVKDLREE